MPASRQRLIKAAVILVGLGATLGSALDAIHSHFGATSYRPRPVRCAILSAIFLTGWALCDRTPLGLAIAALAALFGPAVEITLIRAGVFVHHEAHLLGIPVWLPFLYLTASVGLGSLARWLTSPPAK